MGKFVFRSRFENQNVVHSDIDEQIMGVIRERDAAEFANFQQIKSNTAILFRKPLANDIFDNLYQYIDSAMGVVATAIDRLFPDAEYANNANTQEAGGRHGDLLS